MSGNKTLELRDLWFCFKGGKGHKAYLHSNVGANIIWCKKHGLLASCTMRLGIGKGCDKQMTKKQYKKFILDKVKK